MLIRRLLGQHIQCYLCTTYMFSKVNKSILLIYQMLGTPCSHLSLAQLRIFVLIFPSPHPNLVLKSDTKNRKFIERVVDLKKIPTYLSTSNTLKIRELGVVRIVLPIHGFPIHGKFLVPKNVYWEVTLYIKYGKF